MCNEGSWSHRQKLYDPQVVTHGRVLVKKKVTVCLCMSKHGTIVNGETH